jgi:hypothetical protein|tara:strand:- start:341 stop:586 length:246 start_codon:yes stop_codon:yes gene_type:complete
MSQIQILKELEKIRVSIDEEKEDTAMDEGKLNLLTQQLKKEHNVVDRSGRKQKIKDLQEKGDKKQRIAERKFLQLQEDFTW